MVDWKTLKKLDAHIHILPDEVHEANPDSEDPWLCTTLRQYASMMEKLHIEKAVIMPLNDPGSCPWPLRWRPFTGIWWK